MRPMPLRLIAAALALALLLPPLLAGGALAVSEWQARALESRLMDGARPTPAVLTDAAYAALPSPVRRYVDFALGDRRRFPHARFSWTEDGTFTLPELGTFTMRGRQTSRVDAATYVWRGYMWRAGGLMLVETRDAFSADDTHDMRGKLWGLKTIMHTAYDAPADRDSLHAYLRLRYYGTALNFPWVLVTDPAIWWEADAEDPDAAWMTITDAAAPARYRVTFAADGRITRMDSPDMHLHGNGELLRESSTRGAYADWDGMKVPTHMTYTWTSPEGAVTRYDFRIVSHALEEPPA